MMIVYLITNLINGKYYVGRTKRSLSDRWYQHIHCGSIENDYLLHRAIKKYGIENFVIEVIGIVSTIEEMIDLEQLWILFLRSYDRSIGYNMTYGGEGFGYGAFPEEQRKAIGRKISLANKGRKLTVEQVQAMRERTISEEQKRRLATLRLGKKVSSETKKKMSKAIKAAFAKDPSIVANLVAINTGSKRSPEVRALLSKLAKERQAKLWQDPEYRKLQSKARTGRTLSEEHRKHLSEGVKKGWDLRRQRLALQEVN
jgi:group I intron endonuclease